MAIRRPGWRPCAILPNRSMACRWTVDHSYRPDIQNDTFRGVVSGTIRGARTVRINPTGSDTYEIVLEIDRDDQPSDQHRAASLRKI